ncbi:DUF6153 family protein [Streptomyces sp. V4I2]|uniref:DUF6153 family protein n=1 Tax=Streptomyces sp. V4I2 TaxID=3042280 RepID=UPI002782AE70|nr:DUF6153 family protein [Streptomyces sp. V4I2]MDQ1044957.1 hypothetical protein [Streptomyces sp. V4I2]
MAIRTAPSGGTAVRWTYGVFLTLCVALAVLVHHEMSETGASPMPMPMPSAVHAAHTAPTAMPGTATADDNGGCSTPGITPGMQHCTTASVDSVQLATPTRGASDPLAHPRPAEAGRTPGVTVGRAPPDLSVLSRLRL